MPRPTSAIALAVEPYADDGPRWVVAQAEAELVVRYGSLHHGETGLTAAMFDPPAGAFVVGRAGTAGPVVGGVGVRAVDHDLPGRRGEIRRLWVDPEWRGRGVGRRLMEAVERAACDLGLTSLRLITGPRQPEAVRLYAASGWESDPTNSEANGFRFTKELVGVS
jgi:ribosomal protein S18 acetylase RimI-like enzyme